MGQKKLSVVIQRQKYSSQFKEQAVERAKKDGVPRVARELGIAEAMLYAWRKKYETTGIPFEDQKLLMCRVLSVSCSGYYAWVKEPESFRVLENRKLALAIKTIYEAEKQRVGSPRITKRLQHLGHTVGKNRVALIMRKNGWRAKGVKKFKATTNSRHALPVAPNLLQKFCSDAS